MIKLKCIFDVEKNEDLKNEYRKIVNSLRDKYGQGQYKRFAKYDSENNPLFKDYKYKSEYAKSVHTGTIREGIELTELELSMICDDGFSHFGGSSYIRSDRSFKVEIYTD